MSGPLIVAILCAFIGAGGAIMAAFIARAARNKSPWRQLEALQADVLMLRRHIFKLQGMLAERGLRAPEVPRLRSEEWE